MWYLFVLFHRRNHENRKKCKTLKGKTWHPTTLESPTHGYFRFPSNLAPTQRYVYTYKYIYMYEFRSHALWHKIKSGEYFVFYFYEMIKSERFLTSRFLRLDDHAVFWTRIANAKKEFQFIRLCRSIRGNWKRSNLGRNDHESSVQKRHKIDLLLGYYVRNNIHK